MSQVTEVENQKTIKGPREGLGFTKEAENSGPNNFRYLKY